MNFTAILYVSCMIYRHPRLTVSLSNIPLKPNTKQLAASRAMLSGVIFAIGYSGCQPCITITQRSKTMLMLLIVVLSFRGARTRYAGRGAQAAWRGAPGAGGADAGRGSRKRDVSIRRIARGEERVGLGAACGARGAGRGAQVAGRGCAASGTSRTRRARREARDAGAGRMRGA